MPDTKGIRIQVSHLDKDHNIAAVKYAVGRLVRKKGITMSITSMNRVIVSGNIGQDAELRETSSGAAVLSFSVAVNDRKQNKQTGEWEDYPNWVNCVLFGKLAEALAPRATKGTRVTVEGKLHFSAWEDKNGGGKRSKLDVWVDNIEFGEAKQSGTAPAPASVSTSAPVYDEDIPF